MQFQQIIAIIMLAVTANASPQPEGVQLEARQDGTCVSGQVYCAKYLKNQGSGPGQNLGWTNRSIRRNVLRQNGGNIPSGLDISRNDGTINTLLFLCGRNNSLSYVARCDSADDCQSYTSTGGNRNVDQPDYCRPQE